MSFQTHFHECRAWCKGESFSSADSGSINSPGGYGDARYGVRGAFGGYGGGFTNNLYPIHDTEF